ncbi:hypothetical protein V8E54_011043 [Elaphomyces granulatus]
MSAILMSHEDYTVAWICALPLEAAVAKTMLDKIHPQLSQPPGDDNAYTLGEISGHNIVVACLPSGVYGVVSAATVVAHMRITFPSIRFGLMVGIGGGVPSTKNDIRLGDVVVSKPTDAFGGVVQYDHGKIVTSGVFQQTGMMNQPPQVLLNAIARLHADDIMGGQSQSIAHMISDVLNENVEMKAPCSRPADEQDTLFNSAYDHPQHEDTCINCDKRQLIHRDPRTSDEPRIHYGLIASGNQVMKHGKTRDQLGRRLGMLCFEMEAAGLMNQLPCLVIRGICDYSDSHKNKQWQGYAALTAAAYAKILLSMVSVNRFRKSQTSQNGCWMVPFNRNPRFLGRHNEIVELEQKILNNNDQVRKMAITGLGGVGKTQIALEIAYQVKDRKPECSIFWIPSTSIEMIEQAYMRIGKHLGLQGVTPAEMKMRVKAHLSSEKAGPWLLIVDNVDDRNIWLMSDGSSLALNTYLPQSKYGFVLFTSRNQQLATKLVGPDVINICQMDDKMATDLLRASLIRKDLVNDQQTTRQLLRQLSCLPLAITQVASYINETGTSVATYLSFLQSQENVMVELLSQDFEDEWRYGINNSVAVTWLVSFKQIQRLNPLALDYLLFMSCIDPRDIPLSLLPPDSSKVKQQNALGLLKAYSFITEQADGQTDREYLVQRVAQCLYSDGRYDQAGALFKEVLENKSKRLKNDDEEMLGSMAWMALAYLEQGRWTEAEKLFVQVVQTRKTVLGPQHPDTLTSMNDLAVTYRSLGQWTEAEKLFVQVVQTRKTVLGPQHPDTLTSMNDLAVTYRSLGQWTEAEKLFVQVVQMRKTVLGPEHPDTLTSMNDLAHTYGNLGRWTEAEKLFVQVMQTRKIVLGPQHPDTLTSLNNLVATYWNQGRWTEAGELQVQVLETRKTVLGPEHPHTLISMNNLALIYQDQGRWTEAGELQVQVLETRKTVLGPNHPDTLRSMNNLSHILKNLRRHDEALSMLQACVQLRNQRLGPSHPDTVDATATLKRWQIFIENPSIQGPASTSVRN